jgi:segregation and condensation protein B
LFYHHLKPHLEALLFAAGDPIAPAQLAKMLDIPEEHVQLLLAELVNDMASAERGLTVMEVGGGYQLVTKEDLADTVKKLAGVQEAKLSLPALETLSIIAFKQPITRQEIEQIRGVKVDGVIATLQERRLIHDVGRKEAIGRPILYGTTQEFLLCFGLKNISELPRVGDLLPKEE